MQDVCQVCCLLHNSLTLCLSAATVNDVSSMLTGAAGATGDAAIVMVRANGREMMVDLVSDPGTVYPVVANSIPQATPPSTPTSLTQAGLDELDGDMEGPDLIQIKEQDPDSQVHLLLQHNWVEESVCLDCL